MPSREGSSVVSCVGELILQQCDGLLRNDHGSNLCATYWSSSSLIVVDGAADEVHSSASNDDTSSL